MATSGRRTRSLLSSSGSIDSEQPPARASVRIEAWARSLDRGPSWSPYRLLITLKMTSAERSGSSPKTSTPTGIRSVGSKTTMSSWRAGSTRSRKSVTASPLPSMRTTERPAAASCSARLTSMVDLPVPIGPMTCSTRLASSMAWATGRASSSTESPRMRPVSGTRAATGSSRGCACGTPGRSVSLAEIGQPSSAVTSETPSSVGHRNGSRMSSRARSEDLLRRRPTPGASNPRKAAATFPMRRRARSAPAAIAPMRSSQKKRCSAYLALSCARPTLGTSRMTRGRRLGPRMTCRRTSSFLRAPDRAPRTPRAISSVAGVASGAPLCPGRRRAAAAVESSGLVPGRTRRPRS